MPLASWRSNAVRGVGSEARSVTLRSPYEARGYTPEVQSKNRIAAGSAQLSKNQEESELYEADLKKLPER